MKLCCCGKDGFDVSDATLLVIKSRRSLDGYVSIFIFMSGSSWFLFRSLFPSNSVTSRNIIIDVRVVVVIPRG